MKRRSAARRSVLLCACNSVLFGRCKRESSWQSKLMKRERFAKCNQPLCKQEYIFTLRCHEFLANEANDSSRTQPTCFSSTVKAATEDGKNNRSVLGTSLSDSSCEKAWNSLGERKTNVRPNCPVAKSTSCNLDLHPTKQVMVR